MTGLVHILGDAAFTYLAYCDGRIGIEKEKLTDFCRCCWLGWVCGGWGSGGWGQGSGMVFDWCCLRWFLLGKKREQRAD